MRTTSILIALLAATYTLQQHATIKGCATWDKYLGTCRSCARRQVTTHGCGPLLPMSDPCLGHAEKVGQKTDCVFCKFGHGLTQDGQCVPAFIFDCSLVTVASNGAKKCVACMNGLYPTVDGTACSPLASGAVANCMWGGLVQGSSQTPYCTKCIPGYVATDLGKSCVKFTANTTGCLLLNLDNSACRTCDIFAGYSMQKNGKCKFIKGGR